MTTGPLEPFLNPRSVAIVGLSKSAVDAPISVLSSLRKLGYTGRICVINPNLRSSAQVEAYPSVADLPGPVDLAIVSVERRSVLGVLEACVARGIGAAIVITQGFADADAEGRAMQESIVAMSRKSGLRIVGPNTVGVVNAFARFTSSFIEVAADTTPIGQVAQSGLFMMGHHLINNEPAGYCLSVDLGNACDVGLIDVLRHFESDDRVRVIQCHLEGIVDGTGFLDAASRISRSKPIVALKAGTTMAGQAAVASHTGAVAGSNEVYAAAFRKAGVIQAANAEELRLVSKAFAVYQPPRGKRIAIVSFSGGGAILAIDAIDRVGLRLAKLSESTRAGLRGMFPPWIEVDNPLDIWMPVAKDFETAFPAALESVLQDPEVDAVICIYCSYQLPAYADYDSSRHIGRIATRHPHKPVLCWSYGLDIEGFTKRIESSGPAMVFPSLDGLAATLAKLCDYGARRAAPAAERAPRRDGKAETFTRNVIAAALKNNDSYLFDEALQVLQAYGLTVAPAQLIRDERELSERLGSFSYPVCLKVVSPDVIHKSDVGGVVLGVPGPTELVTAHRALRQAMQAKLPGCSLTGVLVQPMLAGGKEIMIGMKRDAVFGPCIVFGAGGKYAEMLDDFAFRIAPISERDALEMIEETRVAKILHGVRGEPPCRIAAVAEALVKLSDLACAHPEISEIDINPMFVDERDAVVVDTRFIIGADDAGPDASKPAAHS